jgi:hypothetical protein
MATYRAWVASSGGRRVAAHSLGPRSPETGCVSFAVFWHRVLTVGTVLLDANTTRKTDLALLAAKCVREAAMMPTPYFHPPRGT